MISNLQSNQSDLNRASLIVFIELVSVFNRGFSIHKNAAETLVRQYVAEELTSWYPISWLARNDPQAISERNISQSAKLQGTLKHQDIQFIWIIECAVHNALNSDIRSIMFDLIRPNPIRLPNSLVLCPGIRILEISTLTSPLHQVWPYYWI